MRALLTAPSLFTSIFSTAEYNNWKVPEILLSGNSLKIEEWRHEQAIEKTKKRRPDLLDS